MQTIHLIEDKDFEKVNVNNFIETWNKLNGEDKSCNLVRVNDVKESKQADILLVNTHLSESFILSVESLLNSKPGISICFFVSPKEISLIERINNIEKENPLSCIGTILKPTQYSKVDKFIDATFKKKNTVEFDDNLDDFDINSLDW